MKAQIIPAILTDHKQELREQLERLSGLTDWLSIDIADGVFVDSVTLTPADLAEFNIPFKLELHLMVNNPQSYFLACNKLGAKRVIFHVEADGDVRQLLGQIKLYDFEVGLALNPHTELKAVAPFVEEVDAILLLAVWPGRQGQEFIPETIERIKRLKVIAPHVKIEVDGGVNRNNIKEVAAAGADILIVGSAIVGQSDYRQAIQSLESSINSTSPTLIAPPLFGKLRAR